MDTKEHRIPTSPNIRRPVSCHILQGINPEGSNHAVFLPWDSDVLPFPPPSPLLTTNTSSSVAPGSALPSRRTYRPGSQLEQLRRRPSAALPPTFIVVISSDVPMPSHRGTQGVCHSPFQRTRLRRKERTKRGPQTCSAPSWLPPGLCAKRLRIRDVLRAHDATASSQGHSRPPDSACALGGRRKAPPTSELTDVGFHAGNSLSSFHAVGSEDDEQ